MKLIPTIKEGNHTKRLKLLITQEQFRRLASNVIAEQEKGKIKKTYLVNELTNGKKK